MIPRAYRPHVLSIVTIPSQLLIPYSNQYSPVIFKFRKHQNTYSTSQLPKGVPDPWDMLTEDEKKQIEDQLESIKSKSTKSWKQRVLNSRTTGYAKIFLILMILIISICLQSIK